MLRSLEVQLLISVDYRPLYRLPLLAHPRTPLLVWIQDPRPMSDVAKVNTLRLPDGSHAEGLDAINCTNFRQIASASRFARRQLLFASPARFLKAKAVATLGVEIPEPVHLGYPVWLPSAPGPKVRQQRPSFVFLGRLDPIKRPWIFAELAKALPDYDFHFLGKAHFRSSGLHETAPKNLFFHGHVESSEKWALLQAASGLVNCSIHEALPVSFMEALSVGTPLISCQDPDGLTTAFGSFVGFSPGDGLDLVPAFAHAIAAAAEDDALLERGASGQEFARTHHGQGAVIAQLKQILSQLDIATS